MTNKPTAAPVGAVQSRAIIDLELLPASHRLGYWIDQVCAASAEADCELGSEPGQLHGRLEHLRVGDIAINQLRVSAQTFRRTRPHLNRAREDVFALVQVCSGSAQVEMDERRISLACGDLAINSGLTTGAMHLAENSSVMLTVIPAGLMQSITGVPHPRGTLHIPREGPVAPLLRGFLRSLSEHADQLSRDAAAQLRNGLLSTVAAAWTIHAQPPGGDLSQLADYHRARVLAFMREHLATAGLDVAAIAAGVGLSKSQIHRLFPARDSSPMRSLWALRLEHARQLLESARPPSLSDVAWRCGYQTQAHFTHSFKQHHGVTPSVYLAARKNHATAGFPDAPAASMRVPGKPDAIDTQHDPVNAP